MTICILMYLYYYDKFMFQQLNNTLFLLLKFLILILK